MPLILQGDKNQPSVDNVYQLCEINQALKKVASGALKEKQL